MGRIGLIQVRRISSHVATVSSTLSKATPVRETSLSRVLVVLPKHKVQGFSDFGNLQLGCTKCDQLSLLLGDVAPSQQVPTLNCSGQIHAMFGEALQVLVVERHELHQRLARSPGQPKVGIEV